MPSPKLALLVMMIFVLSSINAHTKGLKSTSTDKGWKTYSNKKYGFEFQYPAIWTYEGKDIEVIDLSGTVTAIQINFSAPDTKNILLIEYTLAPKGLEKYKYVLAQYNSTQDSSATGKSLIKVAGNKAIKTTSVMSIDGRGMALNPPMRLVLVDFLDKAVTGEFQFQLKTPSSEDEAAKLTRLLSTFVFKK
jgi:hypothetical protein